MSKIQEALRELQEFRQQAGSNGKHTEARFQGAEQSVQPLIPDPRTKRTRFDGPKHAVNLDELIESGLLPAPEHAAQIEDEFRLIKRPLIENATISFGIEGHQTNVIMIASAMPGSGKSFCSVNLASSIAIERELNVLLVDADVAKPHISTALDLGNRPGLTDILEDSTIPIENALIRCDLNDIQVLPAGRRHLHSTELLASERMTRVITELATRYPDRIIVMDSPPLLATSEAQALAQKVGQIVLVVEYGATQHAQIRECLNVLDESKPINVILNKCLHARSGGYYGGRYGQYGIDRDQ